MKLKTLTPENVPSTGRAMAPNIGMNIKGAIRFNSSAAKLVGLTDKSQVLFHQDEDSPGDWYFEVTKSGGFKMRVSSGKMLSIQCAAIVQQVFSSVEFTGTSGRVLIAQKPVTVNKKELWPLITAKLNA